jgi:pentatricopeptide repeat protein
MQPKLTILKLFKNSLAPVPHQINRLLAKHLSTITQFPLTHDSPFSPESPSRLTRDPKLSDPENGNFFISPLANWVDNPTLENFKSIAAESGTGGDIDKVKGILKRHFPSEDAVVKALDESGINATNDLVSQLLERFSNQWITALGVFIWAKNQTGYVHTPRLYDLVVDILGKCKKFGIMWKVVNEMNELNGHVSFSTMSIVVRRLASSGMYKDAIDVLRGLEKYRVKKDTVALNMVMHALAKQGGAKDAYSVFLEFKDSITLDSHSFNILIHGYCEARMLDDARKTMEEMEKHGFRPDASSYTCFIKAYCKQKDFRNVEVILNEMGEKGCEPDVIAYSIYIRALGKARKINEALEV